MINILSFSNPYRLNKYRSFIWWFIVILLTIFIIYHCFRQIIMFIIQINLFTGFFFYELIKKINNEYYSFINQIIRFIYYLSATGIFLFGLFINIFIISIIFLIYFILGCLKQFKNALLWHE